MALKPHCDRCGIEGQITPVLGVDCCATCISELRAWLSPIYRAGKRKKYAHDRMRHALHFIARKGYVTDEMVADANQEPRRTAYFALYQLSKSGHLIHLGRGKFVLPEPKATLRVVDTSTNNPPQEALEA